MNRRRDGSVRQWKSRGNAIPECNYKITGKIMMKLTSEFWSWPQPSSGKKMQRWRGVLYVWQCCKKICSTNMLGPILKGKNIIPKNYKIRQTSKEAYYQGSDRFFLNTIMANYGPVRGYSVCIYNMVLIQMTIYIRTILTIIINFILVNIGQTTHQRCF